MRQLWQNVEFLFIDEISMVPYEMLCMIDSHLRQLKSPNACFGDINVLLFGDLLPPVRGHQVFRQPEHMKPATHLWRQFRLVELKQNMRQQGDTTFIDVLNALRVGELTSGHFEIFLEKVSTDTSNEFSIEKALRICPTNDQVARHKKRFSRVLRCQRFGHSKNVCRGRYTCPNSGSTDHVEQRIFPAKCASCSGDHPSNARICPQWTMEKQIQKVKARDPHTLKRRENVRLYTSHTPQF
ncbi:ATP-dependent DNA helicase [Caerostris darwini]|uniref:ATP-dependent DNA helicase n=1 Tax=Caerostris darwini TaxID=1538125 RepID=A0AAV4U4H2_9ARAC|nr:ATP-dependent DNA helicase [Caerostris darwini]